MKNFVCELLRLGFSFLSFFSTKVSLKFFLVPMILEKISGLGIKKLIINPVGGIIFL